MGRQRLRGRVLGSLYDAITANTERLSVAKQATAVKTVADIAERMEIEDIESLTWTIQAIGTKGKRATKKKE